MELTPYQHPADLPRVLAFLGECNRDSDFRFSVHPGNFAHHLSNGRKGADPTGTIFLYEPAGVLTAIVTLFAFAPCSYDINIRPDAVTPQLYRELIAFCEAQARAHIPAGADPYDQAYEVFVDCQDYNALLREVQMALGYTHQPQPYMRVTLRSLLDPLPEAALPPGLTMRGTTEADVEQLCAVHNSAFGSKWTPEFYLKVMRTPGFDPARELVAIAPDGRFAAFVIIWPDPVSKCGLFEPVGVHEDFRQRGIGKALLVEGMRRMLDAGMTRAMVEHEVANPASTALYAAAGFRVIYSYFEATKRLAM